MLNEPNPVCQESLFIDAVDGSRLHLRHIYQQATGTRPVGPAVLMVHGAIANARTFYSDKGRGLGPWLAQQGFDVYVLDLRGRGLSTPRLSRAAQHGQTESICEDIPAALREIERRRTDVPKIHLVGHSWGGVLISAMLARYPAWARRVSGCVYLGSKRSIRVWNWRRMYEIDVFWSGIATAMTRVYGYLPADRWGIGADGESAKSLRQSQQWVRARDWRDSDDDFDYRAALNVGLLPPILYLVGGNDPVRGHPDDVRRFIKESGPHRHAFRLLSVGDGFSRDFGHLDMLTHSSAEAEVYPLVRDWLEDGEILGLSTATE